MDRGEREGARKASLSQAHAVNTDAGVNPCFTSKNPLLDRSNRPGPSRECTRNDAAGVIVNHSVSTAASVRAFLPSRPRIIGIHSDLSCLCYQENSGGGPVQNRK